MCHSNTHLNVHICKVLTWSEYISRGWVALSIQIQNTATILVVAVFWCYIISILGLFNSILNPRPQCWENVAEMIEPQKPLVLTSKYFPLLLSKHLPWLFCFKTALRCAGKYQIPTFVDRARLERVDILAPFLIHYLAAILFEHERFNSRFLQILWQGQPHWKIVCKTILDASKKTGISYYWDFLASRRNILPRIVEDDWIQFWFSLEITLNRKNTSWINVVKNCPL